MGMCKEVIGKVLGTLFPKPRYDLFNHVDSSGFSYYLYDKYDNEREIFIFYSYNKPEVYFRNIIKNQNEFLTLNEIFNLNQIGLHSYAVKGFKDDSE